MKDQILKAIKEIVDVNKDGVLDGKDVIQIASVLFKIMAERKKAQNEIKSQRS